MNNDVTSFTKYPEFEEVIRKSLRNKRVSLPGDGEAEEFHGVRLEYAASERDDLSSRCTLPHYEGSQRTPEGSRARQSIRHRTGLQERTFFSTGMITRVNCEFRKALLPKRGEDDDERDPDLTAAMEKEIQKGMKNPKPDRT
ncbi:MAG: hypothetical protein Q9217_003194 [Psora testacea]